MRSSEEGGLVFEETSGWSLSMSHQQRMQRRQKAERIRNQCKRARRAEGCCGGKVMQRSGVRGVAGDEKAQGVARAEV